MQTSGRRPDQIDVSEILAARNRRSRVFRLIWRTATRVLALLPLRLRGPRQLAREAVLAGAIQKVRELERLADLVRDFRPATVLEIGSFTGGTLGLFCKLATADALVVSIDLPAEYGGATAVELEALGRARQRVVALRRDSQADATVAELRAVLDGRDVDLLMIDGDHSYEAVRRDFELYSPLVRDGGLVAFHDIVPHVRVAGVEVAEYWAEVRGRYEHVELVEPGESGFGPWGGIGVLRYSARGRA